MDSLTFSYYAKPIRRLRYIRWAKKPSQGVFWNHVSANFFRHFPSEFNDRGLDSHAMLANKEEIKCTARDSTQAIFNRYNQGNILISLFLIKSDVVFCRFLTQVSEASKRNSWW